MCAHTQAAKGEWIKQTRPLTIGRLSLSYTEEMKVLAAFRGGWVAAVGEDGAARINVEREREKKKCMKEKKSMCEPVHAEAKWRPQH